MDRGMRQYIKLFMFISVLLLSACNEWLDVQQEGEIEADELYKDGEGYRAVLNKVYKLMAEPTFYGENLSYGMVDCMSQQYELTEASNANSMFRSFMDFKYTDNGVQDKINSTWLKGFNVIANANDLLQHLRNASSDVFEYGEIERNLLMGEAFACRALVHFDLLRLFAPRLEDAGTETFVPYVENYPDIHATSIAVQPFLEKVITDLMEAKRLVAEFDTSTSGKLVNATVSARMSAAPVNNFEYDTFFAGRVYRLNYYSITALLARVYQWAGKSEDAFNCAKEVTQYALNGEAFYSDNFSGMKVNDGHDITAFDQKSDYKITSNIVFAVYNKKAYDNTNLQTQFKPEHIAGTSGQNQYFVVKSSNFESRGADEMAADVRYKNMIFNAMGQYPVSGKYYIPSSNPENAEHLMIMPVIRLTEMRYIMAEYYASIGEFSSAYEILNDIRQERGLTALSSTNSFNEFVSDLIEDARREWVSEGQLFYLYKRLNAAFIKNGESHRLTRSEAILPLPSDQK